MIDGRLKLLNEMEDYGFDLEKIGQGYDLSTAMNSCRNGFEE